MAGIATIKPTAVATRALDIPAITTAEDPVSEPKAEKASITPKIVP